MAEVIGFFDPVRRAVAQRRMQVTLVVILDPSIKFFRHYLEGDLSLSSLCRAFGISRKTGYKYIARYKGSGLDGLLDLSRAPHRYPHSVSDSVVRFVLRLRKLHPSWGPKKLRVLLQRNYPDLACPAASTIGEILKRHGMTVPAVDYFDIQPVFESAFREYGLPIAIRTDNGPPFATTTVGGLSKLSIWWLHLGIIPERIRPGHPEQNGRHERMHRTLKQETALPSRANWRKQQKAFDRFQEEYNWERPHEAIDMDIPGNLYEISSRPYPPILPEIIYPDDMAIRSVKSQGDISWKHKHIYLSKTLAGQLVGLRQIDDRFWDIYFAGIKLAKIDTYELKLKHLTKNYKQNENNLLN